MKKVIYTCLTGDYDKLEQPLFIHPDYDYICFSDHDGSDGVWTFRRIPIESKSNTVRARFPKLQPHVLLQDYDYSIFMDANIRILDQSFYDIVENSIKQGVLFAGLQHPDRKCVYDELCQCYLKDKISTRAAFRHLAFLKRIKMPRFAGLFEANILLRKHNDARVISADDMWWHLFTKYSTRDQLTLTPALFLTGEIWPQLLLGEGLCARNVPYLSITRHLPTGKENVPGTLSWGNVKYRIRLLWRKLCLPFLTQP